MFEIAEAVELGDEVGKTDLQLRGIEPVSFSINAPSARPVGPLASNREPRSILDDLPDEGHGLDGSAVGASSRQERVAGGHADERLLKQIDAPMKERHPRLHGSGMLSNVQNQVALADQQVNGPAQFPPLVLQHGVTPTLQHVADRLLVGDLASPVGHSRRHPVRISATPSGRPALPVLNRPARVAEQRCSRSGSSRRARCAAAWRRAPRQQQPIRPYALCAARLVLRAFRVPEGTTGATDHSTFTPMAAA